MTRGQPPMTHAGQWGSEAKPEGPDPSSVPGVVDEIEVRGHIVDSLLLPKILDRILQMGGSFEIHECKIGVRRSDPSYARIGIRADSSEAIDAILGDLVEHGASPVHTEDARTVPADIPGAFPDAFYSTTNQRTQVRFKGRWIDIQDQEMDCGIALDPASGVARCVPMIRVTLGMPIVVGHAGVRVLPVERPRESTLFGFMSSSVSSEKPKSVSLKSVAEAIRATRAAGKKVLMVGGPAIVHTGSVSHVAKLIRDGWVQTVFAGNALAAHDVEQALFGTSLASRSSTVMSTTCAPSTPSAGRAVWRGRSRRACSPPESCTNASNTRSISSWPGRSATTARCPRSSLTRSWHRTGCARRSATSASRS